MLTIALSTSGLGGIVSGMLADRVGKRTLLSVTVLVYSLGSLITGLAPSPGVFLLGRAIVGLVSGCTAGFGALLAELFPSEIRAGAMGTTYNLARAAQLGAPLLVTVAVQRHGLAGGLSVPLGLALLTASWVWTLPETRGIALPSLNRRNA